MRWSARVLVIAGVTACSSAPEPSWHQEAGYRWRDLVVSPGRAGFTEMQGWRSGIRFTNSVSESSLVANRILGQGAGVAMGDVDGDGRPDLFLARTEGCSALYRNNGGWKFEDITKAAGLGLCDRNTTGVTFADVDGDRDLDLVMVATAGPNAVFLNDGHARFSERRDLGLDPTGKGGTSIAMADVDGDGLLDMYVANYQAYNVDDRIPPQQRAFNQLVREVGNKQYVVNPQHAADYKIVMRPDMGGMRLTVRAAPDDFYKNVGGRFTRVSMASPTFLDALGAPLTAEPESFGLGAKFADLNGDGAPDLYVTNDYEDLDQLWINNGKGTFRLGDWRTQRQMSNSAMGVDIGDLNGDTLADIFAVDMLSNESRRLKTQLPTHSALPKRPGDFELQLQQQRNTLFLNRGDGTYAEVAQAAGVGASGWSWATMITDVDLDGWQDMLVANGHLWDLMDADTQERLQNRLTDVGWQRMRWQFPRLELKNVAFRNQGDGTFSDASALWSFGKKEDISHTMAAGDLDGDGDLDVVVNRLDAPALVLQSGTTAPRVTVRLVGDAPNTRAVGARIKLIGGARPIQMREVTAGGLYMSHSDYDVSFAMGRADSATIEIDWRDGYKSTIRNVRPNRLYEVTTGGAAAAMPSDRAELSPSLFEDASPALAGHVHGDSLFDDWESQFLLPNSLSLLGPGVSWFDYDRDGDEDLIVGTGRGFQPAVFRNDRGKFVPQKLTLPVSLGDWTTVLGLPAKDGKGSRLLAGVSSWEGSVPSAVVSVAATRTAVAAKTDSVVGALPVSAGPLALGDYDGDGDLDLFVGGRVIGRHYPEPATSGFFRNDSGAFVFDPARSGVLRDVGMVSSAMFADIDGDGKPDLVVAREWSSIGVFLNRDGRFIPVPESWGLQRWTSRWNGIAAGDLDGDGRLDLVATSWGRNTAMQADSANPLVITYGRFGAANAEEAIIARKDARLNALVPLNSYPRVRIVMKNLVSRVSSFSAFADATLDQVLGPVKDSVRSASIVTQDHMVFINKGDRFEGKALPAEAQLAPAFYAGVADFDGDGSDDVFLSQNFSATVTGLPRYDTGRGLLLTGDGHGTLSPMPGARSGIVVYGDQRGAAFSDYDGDGRLDLVVSQNSAATKLLHNRGAKQGLRVRLVGAGDNPDAIGAQVRLVYAVGMGPVREVQAGSGYWSQNGAVQVFGTAGTPTEVWVRWPGGAESRTKVPSGAREVTVRQSP
jgi:hypothetical protein